MAQTQCALTVVAEVAVLVPRGTTGDLTTAARRVLAGVDCVTTVEAITGVGFRPRATDVEVRFTARLTISASGDADAVAERLVDGIGVRTATVIATADVK